MLMWMMCSKKAQRTDCGLRIADFDAPSAGCGVGSWEKFATPGQSEPVKQPIFNSIRAILLRFAGGSGIAGGKLRAASSVRYRGHGFRTERARRS